MKRFHIHVSVPNLGKSIKFYNSLFGTEPNVTRDNYAKWMLDNPAVNFAISTGRNKVGLNHLGFQFDSDEEVYEVENRLLEKKYSGSTEKMQIAAMPIQINTGRLTRPVSPGNNSIL